MLFRYSLCSFVEIDKATLKTSWQKQNLDDFEAFVKSRALNIKTFIVPTVLDDTLRIKLVSIEEFEALKKRADSVEHNGFQYIFSTENKNLRGTPGVLVSCWRESHLVKNPMVTDDFVKSMQHVYGKNGYGFRDACDHQGFHFFRGERANKRPHPTPFVADDEIDLHQYFNMSVENDCILLQAEMEKRINN